ncbi:unnamed protein product [Sphacelaria rigidula]
MGRDRHPTLYFVLSFLLLSLIYLSFQFAQVATASDSTTTEHTAPPSSNIQIGAVIEQNRGNRANQGDDKSRRRARNGHRMNTLAASSATRILGRTRCGNRSELAAGSRALAFLSPALREHALGNKWQLRQGEPVSFSTSVLPNRQRCR